MSQYYDIVTVGSYLVEVTPTTPGEPLQEAMQYTLVAGGAAANVVFAMARLGVRVGFITAVGDDEFGTLLARELAAFDVDDAGMRRVAGQLTTVSFCAVDGLGGKVFRFYRFPGHSAPMAALTAADFTLATRCRLFDFSEGSIRDPGLRGLVFDAARQARAAGIPVLYAVNLRRASWRGTDAEVGAVERAALALADIAVLNDEELRCITGWTGADGVAALREIGPRVVVVTRGGDAEILLGVDGELAAIPPYRVPVIYDVGAGDTFHAGLVAAILQGDPATRSLATWTDACRFAAATAAIRVSTSADPHALPTLAVVRAWMERNAVDEQSN